MLQPHESLDLLRRITFKIRIERNEEENWEWGTGFFISPEGYALTAFHNLPGAVVQAESGNVDARYKGQWIQLECLVKYSLPEQEGDIALLKWLQPDRTILEHHHIAYLNPSLSRHERNQFWAGRPVSAFGFPFEERGQGERFVDGVIDAGQPISEIEEVSRSGGGPRIIGKVERIRFLGVRAQDLEGISGAPMLDRETGWVIAVQGSYAPGQNVAYGTEIAHLMKSWPELVNYAKSIMPGTLWGRLSNLRGVRLIMIVVGLLVIACVVWWQSGIDPGAGMTYTQPGSPAPLEPGPTTGESPTPAVLARPMPPLPGILKVSITTSNLPYNPKGHPVDTVPIEGTVSGITDTSELRVVVYAFTNHWYVQPDTGEKALTKIEDGRWRTETHPGARYVALLVRQGYNPPGAPSILPTDGVLAVSNEIHPPQLKRILNERR